MRLDITLPMPPTFNNAQRSATVRRRYTTAEGNAFLIGARLACKSARNRAGFNSQAFSEHKLALTLTLYFPDHRRADLDNRVKLAQDAIADALGFDDRHIDRLIVERGELDPKHPRCEAVIETLGLIPPKPAKKKRKGCTNPPRTLPDGEPMRGKHTKT